MPYGEDLSFVMIGFNDFCELLSVHGVIDCTQIHIQNPRVFTLLIIFPTSPKHILVCNSKLWLTIIGAFKMYL
jgi:hypothetical protein